MIEIQGGIRYDDADRVEDLAPPPDPDHTKTFLGGPRMATFDPTTPERWYPVPGFSFYQISSHFRLKSFHRGSEGRLIKIHLDDRGYRKLILWQDKRYHNLYLHRVVAELVYGPCPEGMDVLHRDDDKSNNWPSNLYHGTASDNMADSMRNGHFVTLRGTQRTNAKLDDARVRAIRRLSEYGIDRGVLAECFDIDRSTICRIMQEDRWSHVKDDQT